MYFREERLSISTNVIEFEYGVYENDSGRPRQCIRIKDVPRFGPEPIRLTACDHECYTIMAFFRNVICVQVN